MDGKGTRNCRPTGQHGGDGPNLGNGNRGLGDRLGDPRDRGFALLTTHAHGPIAGESSSQTRQQRGKKQQ